MGSGCDFVGAQNGEFPERGMPESGRSPILSKISLILHTFLKSKIQLPLYAIIFSIDAETAGNVGGREAQKINDVIEQYNLSSLKKNSMNMNYEFE